MSQAEHDIPCSAKSTRYDEVDNEIEIDQPRTIVQVLMCLLDMLD
jgi:hypothetical protein